MEKKCSNCLHYKACSKWSTTDLDKDEAWRYCFNNFRAISDYVILSSDILNANLMISEDKSIPMRDLIAPNIESL